MAKKTTFFPLLPDGFQLLQNDLADLATKNHSDLDQLTWSTAGHTIDTDVDLAGNDLLNVGTLNINATADHTITNSSDNLVIQNTNSNKDIIFSVKEGSNQENFLTVMTSLANLPQLRIDTANRYNVDTDGFFRIGGLINITTVGVGMAFKPNIQGGQFIAFYNNPTVSAQSTVTGMFFGPNYGNFARLANVITLSLTAHTQGQNDSYTFLSESTSRQSFVFSGTDATTSNWTGFKWGAAVNMGDSTGSNTAYTENMVYLTGGANRALGTGGSIVQNGLRFAGFGIQNNLIGGTDSVRALTADGGFFSFKFDYSATSRILMGAGEDAGFGYDGTDVVIYPQLVGTGGVKIISGDLYFTGDGSGLPYGDMNVEDNTTATTIASSGTWYQVTIFGTDVEENDANVDHTNDHITIGKAGRYFVSFVADVHDGTVNNEYEIAVYKNNGATQLPGMRTHIFFDFATSEPQVALQGIADLANGDTIEVWVKNNTGANNVTFEFANLSLFMLGGT